MATNDVVKLIIGMNVFGQRMTPGLHFQYKTPAGTAGGLITAVRGTIEGTMLPAMSPDVTITDYTVEAKLPDTAASVEVAVVPPTAGTHVGAALPPQNAVVCSLHTGFKSRRRRGRFYAPGATEEGTASGRLIPGDLTLWLTWTGTMTNTYGQSGVSADYLLVVFSPEALTHPDGSPVTPPRPGNLISPVTSITVDDVIRSQRRRQIGRGI
jgi:hypothetical protein